MPAEQTRGLVLVSAAVTMGLVAGLFYAYSVSVMPGLGEADDHTFVEAMQQINEAIENPVFFLSFLGAPALTAAALFMEVARARARSRAGSWPRWCCASSN